MVEDGVTEAAKQLLGKSQWEDLVAAILIAAPALVDEIDPWAIAAIGAVNARVQNPELYRWSKAARGVAMWLAVSAAIEAEVRSRTVAA